MELVTKNLTDVPESDFPDLPANRCLSVIGDPNAGDQLQAFHPWGPSIYICEGLVMGLTFAIYIYIVVRTTVFAPSKRRTMILWVTATPFVMSLLSFIGILVPKSNTGCNYVKTLFMPWVLMYLVNLTLDFHGGVTHLIPKLEKDKVTLATFKSPCCCVGLAWKNVYYNKHTMRIVRGLVQQVPLSQFIIVFVGFVFEKGGLYTTGYLGVNDSYLWLNLLNFGTFFTAMYGVNMIIAMSAERLAHIQYSRKIQMIQLLIIWIKSQTVIMAILRAYGVIPCIHPYLSAKAYKSFIENSLVIGECFLVSIPLAFQYRLRTGSQDRKDELKKVSTTSTICTLCDVPSVPPTPSPSEANFQRGEFVRTVSTDDMLHSEFVAYC